MANVTLSGYLSPVIGVTWTSATQKLDSLTNDEWTDLSDEIDNSSTKYRYADLLLVLGSINPSSSIAGLEIYIVPSVDGTNYPDWVGNVTTDAPAQGIFGVAYLVVTTGSSAKRASTSAQLPVRLPNGKFKFGARNRTGVTLASSGNTLSFRPHTESI